MNNPEQIVIIGAGPAGLMAAEQLSMRGHRVALYDQMPTPARKLLIAGRGGLNLTHSEPLEQFLTRYGSAAQWLAPAIRAFTPDDLRAWCEGVGIETFVGSSGRVFPKQMKAAPLLRAWLARLDALGVRYYPRHRWLGFGDGGLYLRDGDGIEQVLHARACLLALGGASWPRLGSDGAWAEWLRAAGGRVATLKPSNMGFRVNWSTHLATQFAGLPLKPVGMTFQGDTRQGEAMITLEGIEGGIMYAFSAALREAIAAQGSATISLDLRPAMSTQALSKKLGASRGSKSLGSYLRSHGFSSLEVALLHELTAREELLQLNGAALAQQLKALPLKLVGTAGLARAISSAGGIIREAVNEQFMLRNMPGIFVAGEMLDWEAPTGGYLLQACFSTGVAAARGIDDYLRRN